MNLWLRLLGLILSAFWREKLALPWAVSRLNFRVWPHDLDTSLHLNNGRYWTLMDLGRTDLLIRGGLWRAVLREGWTPVINAGAIRFRRELRLFERVRLETRILAWERTHLVIEHRLLRIDGSVAALALVKAAIYDRKARAFVPMSQLMKVMGIEATSPAMPPEAQALLAADEALQRATVQPGPAASRAT